MGVGRREFLILSNQIFADKIDRKVKVTIIMINTIIKIS